MLLTPCCHLACVACSNFQAMGVQQKDIETYCPASIREWRQWLKNNHDKKQSIWLVYYKIKSGKASISWSEAVDQALCFGWIDSTARSLDDERYLQLFTRRKPKSVWSKINKEKVSRLVATKQMAKAGLAAIEVAKQNGSWTILDDVEELMIPADLEKAFKAHKGSKVFFNGLAKSVKKAMLQWLMMAKRPETRQKRITEIAQQAAQQQRPAQFR